MSKEPGVCDSYVKVYDEQGVGVGMSGWVLARDHLTEFQGPSISVRLGPFSVAATVPSFGQ